MTFSEMVTKLIDNIQLKQTVTKIKRYIDQIRNESGVENARRWVIELLQNARDVAFDGQKVKVKIVYDDINNIVTFSHNGRFFRTKDILNIIHQVTSKDKDENSIGQFGTGFMSTYTLSEKVRIDGIAHDDENPDLYKMFTVNIDRTKNDSDGIEESINNSINDFKMIDNNEAIDGNDIDKNAFNTTFTYHLQNETAKKNAMVGIEDLTYNIKYIFLFSGKIDSIEIEKKFSDTNSYIIYKRYGDYVVDELNNIKVATIVKSESENNEIKTDRFNVIYKSVDENNLTVALEIDDIEKKKVLKIDKSTARIFIDFPLIGSEDYHIPFVVNSRNFKPNEERSIIYTSDNESSQNSIDNKCLMNSAIELYKDLINFLNDNSYNSLENALYINPLKESKSTSKTFAIQNVFMNLLVFLYNINMIDCDGNKTNIMSKNTRVLSGSIKNINGMKKILKNTKWYNYSKSKDNLCRVLKTYIDTINANIELLSGNATYKPYIFFDSYTSEYSVLDRSYSLYGLACDAESIINGYLAKNIDYIMFLNELYKVLKDDKAYFDDVVNNDIKLFPVEKYDEYAGNNVNKDVLSLSFDDNTMQINLLPLHKLYFDRVKDTELLRIAIPLMNEKYYTSKNNGLKQQFGINNYECMFSNVLDKGFDISDEDFDNAKILTDTLLKDYINNKMLTFVSNDINNQPQSVQEIAMLLASYIDSASNFTNNYGLAGFISFMDEEAMNSLRSKRVLANMTRRLGECDKLLKEYNIASLEDLETIIKNKQNSSTDFDMFDDPLISFENDDDREEWTRKVGEFGERKAYEIISSELESFKNVSDTSSEYYNKVIELVDENVNEKKEGYDFSILIYDKSLLDDENFVKNDIKDERIKRKLVEVKCSTKTSIYNNIIHLSDSQFKNAMLKGDDYIVYKLLIDTRGSKNENDWKVVTNYKYNNILKAISSKKISILYPTFKINTNAS